MTAIINHTLESYTSAGFQAKNLTSAIVQNQLLEQEDSIMFSSKHKENSGHKVLDVLETKAHSGGEI
ncbi:MAG: hypothetical protein COB67_00115 [SAR324 cluster bacterium]|uniref:Uncharacterized protein n=1 Tax=SAR324 cluster bacterium TaxID=2024889 RepID=A0A2A4TBJ3_9DELT|nr:MAG: hypothetical protein COB67_00115 [SAR324 cluster bacterium]